MADFEPLRFGPNDRAAQELSDAELEQEVRRRRQRRALRQRHLRQRPADGAVDGQLAQFFANLELSVDAGPDEVHAAYARLLGKYRPYLDHRDPERRQAARALLESLERAYRGLLAGTTPEGGG